MRKVDAGNVEPGFDEFRELRDTRRSYGPKDLGQPFACAWDHPMMIAVDG
jgi:hypothetical protein